MTSGLLYRKDLDQSRFWVIFVTSILNNSYNRLKYVLGQIISIAAIENIYLKTNNKMKFYFIWED